MGAAPVAEDATTGSSAGGVAGDAYTPQARATADRAASAIARHVRLEMREISGISGR